MALTIVRHCVPIGAETGLSPLQDALLTDPHPVRIADAPTGAGKSYAFQRAMAQHGSRVLFIVPTRRLAQNLAAGLLRDLTDTDHWERAQAEGKVAVWSSDATLELKDEGVTCISGYRLRQIQALDNTREGGEMVVAIPEVVSHLLLERRMLPGQAATGILNVLAAFEHIVFDEFHTVGSRGFGLAALCASLAANLEWARAKVSFLSATPVEIRPVLERVGVPSEAIIDLRETVLSGTVDDQGRPLHGDVTLEFDDAATLAALVDAHVTDIAAAIADGRQVVVIYDRLGDLQRDFAQLSASLMRAGVSPGRVLAINSIDDSSRGPRAPAGFAAGRHHDPDEFDVLIATSSVEIGVTFRAADLLFMEPGFSPLNFLQRYGRAARRGHDGAVWVRWDPDMGGRAPWLRRLLTWAQENDARHVDIAELTAVLSQERQAEFAGPMHDNARSFGVLPSRAAFTAGLYWTALLRHPSNRGHRHEHLRRHAPSTTRLIRAWIGQVRRMEHDRMIGAVARAWCDRFERLAYVLRDIGPRIRVVEADGNAVDVEEVWLQRETLILDRLSITLGADGRDQIRLPGGTLRDYLRDERERVRRTVTTYFPHTARTADLPVGAELVEAWCRTLRDSRGPECLVWGDYPEAMAASENLVRATGLVVCDDETLSVDSVSRVL